MQCAFRRSSSLFLRRCFSSSAARREIRDVGSLPRRLIPKYQGMKEYLRPRRTIQADAHSVCRVSG